MLLIEFGDIRPFTCWRIYLVHYQQICPPSEQCHIQTNRDDAFI